MIMQANKKDPATVQCPSKKIIKGRDTLCNLTDLSDPCTQAQFATVDHLVSNGIKGFYWDEYQVLLKQPISMDISRTLANVAGCEWKSVLYTGYFEKISTSIYSWRARMWYWFPPSLRVFTYMVLSFWDLILCVKFAMDGDVGGSMVRSLIITTNYLLCLWILGIRRLNLWTASCRTYFPLWPLLSWGLMAPIKTKTTLITLSHPQLGTRSWFWHLVSTTHKGGARHTTVISWSWVIRMQNIGILHTESKRVALRYHA